MVRREDVRRREEEDGGEGVFFDFSHRQTTFSLVAFWVKNIFVNVLSMYIFQKANPKMIFLGVHVIRSFFDVRILNVF